MSTQERIARLEELLARVHARAGAPHLEEPALEPVVASAFAEPPPDDFDDDDGGTLIDVPRVETPITTPPQTSAEPTFGAGVLAAAGLDADVEVSSEVVEVDVDVEEAVAMETAALGDTADLEEEVPRVLGANEVEEPAPSSSRRPVALEQAEGAYEGESAPRHTPPPESGKQVASPSQPPARRSSLPPRESSVPPPPSLEGHTLIGGWREPGLGPNAHPGGFQIGPKVSAPRGAPAPAPAPSPAPAPVAPVAQASGPRLSPDVTKPALPQVAKVAAIEGAVPTFKPATFGDLVDATLAL